MSDGDIDDATREAIEEFLSVVRRTLPVRRAILFGSRARKDHSPDSDADLAVILTGDIRPFAQTKLAMADIAYDVLLGKGILIQPLPIWEQEWEAPESYSNPNLLIAIRRDGIDCTDV